MSYQVKNAFTLGTQLTTTPTSYYTVGIGADTRLGAFTVTNQNASGGANVTYSVYFVPQGGSPGPANCIINENTVVAGKSDPGGYVTLGQVLPAGGSIYMKASANSTLSVFGGITELVS
ncbi:MAG: hypothetical protein ACJ8R9_10925 [Steroidobacteraceae bacterium]